AIRIRSAVRHDGGLVGIEEAAGEPAGKGKAGRGVHHPLVRCRPDDAERLHERVPEPVRITRGLLAELLIARAVMLADELPELAARADPGEGPKTPGGVATVAGPPRRGPGKRPGDVM